MRRCWAPSRRSRAPLLLIVASPSPLRGWRRPHCIVAGGAPPLERGGQLDAVVERLGVPGASLTGFVALARDQHHVSGVGPGHRVLDRLATVADLDDVRSGVGFGCAGKDLAADR